VRLSDSGVADSPASVEQLVRSRLSHALGGRRGMAEAALPTIGFTLTWVSSHDLRLALLVSAAIAGVLLAVRLAQRQTPQFVLNSCVGIAIGALFALRSGEAAGFFLPGIIYNAAYAAGMIVSIAVGWPVVGFLLGAVTGDPTGWRRNPAVVRLCTRLTWVLAIPCVLRVAVQYPLYLADRVGWLGAAKIAMGWPLQLAALAAIAYLLSRDSTPLHPDRPPPVA